MEGWEFWIFDVIKWEARRPAAHVRRRLASVCTDDDEFVVASLRIAALLYRIRKLHDCLHVVNSVFSSPLTRGPRVRPVIQTGTVARALRLLASALS